MKDSVFRDLRRAAAFALCCAMLLTVCGCAGKPELPETGETETSSPELPGGSLSVPYLKTDSLNPFFMKTVINSALVSLFCRGLYAIDNGYDAGNDIAVSEIVSAGSVKVTLDPEAVFSDGSPVTSQDVEYSFGFAKASVLYAERLSGVESCTVSDNNTVLFKLEHADVNVLSTLTFPIVKRGSATAETSLPVSCGHYMFSQDGVRLTLVCNMLYNGDLPSVGTIRLTEVEENTVLETLVDTGELDFCYSDLAKGSAKRTYSSATDIYLNNLVFIGVNHKNVNFGIADIRRAMSLAIDRQEIVTAGFQNFARSAAVPFNTSWSQIADSKTAYAMSFYSSNDEADALLAPYGAGTTGNECFATLLCPESDSFLRNTAGVIVKQLAKNNITVTVQTVGSAEYREALETGAFDLYLGEIKLTPNMDLYAFFGGDGAACYGIDLTACASAESYFGYRSGELPLDDFLNTFIAEMPFVPLCFRNGRMCYTTDISSAVGMSEYDLFGSIDKWKIDRK